MSKVVNNCYKLRRLFEENKLQKGFKGLVSQDVDGIEKYKQRIKQRYEIFEQYKTYVRELLADWAEPKEFIEKVNFSPDGRVEISGNLSLGNMKKINSCDPDFFPALIRAVEGEIVLWSPKFEHVDYLEEAGAIRLLNAGNFKSFARLKKVSGDFKIFQTSIETLPSLQEVEGEFYARELNSLRSLPKLRKAGRLMLAFSGIESLPNLVSVTHSLNVYKTKVDELPQLVSVGLDFYARDSGLASASKLEYVGGSLSIGGTKITKMPSLTATGKAINIGKKGSAGFRSFFPVLSDIGVNLQGVSVYTSLHPVKREVEELVKRGSLSISGKIQIDE